MGFLDRLIGPPRSGSAGSIGVTGQAAPANTSPPADEQEIRQTGDSGPTWKAKADEADAVNAHRRSRRR
ncbi:hypothetical protein OG909_32825 (plasmid) [Streptomyces sp. NBC_01754]|uniref:hypothetical protein n=1 Tax=Streptomyces sp. NBC_01754 TaxID=2975930 RepID=UPI002DD9D728|nr:hypothetical protein [Streptomyces sp. NBC_01754]WSC97091.1 hypothetical protein OG909_32825 [Streptomyces sp. NBC_01754]